VTVTSTTGIRVGDSVVVTSGTGDAGAGNTVASILGPTSLLLALPALVNFASAAVKFFGGGAKTGNIEDGAITASKIGPNVGGYVFRGGYFILSSTTITLPVNVTTSSTRNVPILVPGTTVSGTDKWPWYNGTSSTGDGYAANSTGPYEPINAALISNWADGDYDYYILSFQSFGTNPLSDSEYLMVSMQILVVADTAGTEFQIAPYIRRTSTGIRTIQTQSLNTYTCAEAGVPYVFSYTTWLTVNNDVSTIGTVIRNITGGSDLTVTLSTTLMQQVAT
jgi:hypothetical protein